jgi:hypothetical protein
MTHVPQPTPATAAVLPAVLPVPASDLDELRLAAYARIEDLLRAPTHAAVIAAEWELAHLADPERPCTP